MYAEKRKEERDSCEIDALILDGRLPCRVTDLSEHGARIELEGDLALPKSFTLSLPITHELADKRDVELRWQIDKTAGVRFRLQA